MIACVFPFLLPYFIPVILMANMTSTGKEFGIPQVSPFEVGLYNFTSWGLLLAVLITVIFGVDSTKEKQENDER
ncbi:hypothetical protein [Maribacter halichondriae]|uniref:hypothetical protein n=1 Tax=Maribacter halichondriae TaxID=2980554 RepID=UPI002359226F|nr:hypothetical protein [Maribacter sp. Hal144]